MSRVDARGKKNPKTGTHGPCRPYNRYFWHNETLHAANQSLLANHPACRGILQLGGPVPPPAAGPDVSSHRIRAELSVPAFGLFAWQRWERRADLAVGAAAEPAELCVYRPAWAATLGHPSGRPAGILLGNRCTHALAGRGLRHPCHRDDSAELPYPFRAHLSGRV